MDDFNRRLNKDLTPIKAIDLFGKPDRTIGSGLLIYVYDLSDGTALWLAFPGQAKMLYAKHVQAKGKAEKLPVKLQETHP